MSARRYSLRTPEGIRMPMKVYGGCASRIWKTAFCGMMHEIWMLLAADSTVIRRQTHHSLLLGCGNGEDATEISSSQLTADRRKLIYLTDLFILTGHLNGAGKHAPDYNPYWQP